MIGLPIWFVIGILIAQSPEIGRSLGLPEKVDAGNAIMFAYIGLSGGDFSSGILSQAIKSRRKVVLIFVLLSLALMIIYLFFQNDSMQVFYLLCLGLGFSVGYWALFITIAAEQFGTNIRATVATTVPNFVRGSLLLIIPVFKYVVGLTDIIHASIYVGVATIIIAILSLAKMKETFGKDLNYIEGDHTGI